MVSGWGIYGFSLIEHILPGYSELQGSGEEHLGFAVN